MVKSIAFLLLFLFFVQESTWALSVGGARPLRQRGNNKNSTEDQKKKQEQEDKDAHAGHIRDMPPEEKMTDIDSAPFDKFESELKVSREQKDKINAVKKSIEEKSKELAREQKEARSNFEKAKEPDCPGRAQQYAAARLACGSYNPTLAFNNALANILTLEQREKLRQFQSKVKA
jgi:hypothetical protein